MTAPPEDVLITGYGVFTGHGFGPQALREGVFAGRPAFRPVRRFDPAPFRGTHAAAYHGQHAPLPSGPVAPEHTPTQHEVLLACATAALDMAGLAGPLPAPVLVGTQGDHLAVSRFWNHRTPGTPGTAGTAGTPGTAGTAEPDTALADSLPAALAGRLADDLELSGPRLAFVNACVASASALQHGARLIRAGRADTVLVAGAYLVEREFFAKFDSGRAFAKDGQVRPFCADRTGLLLGDGVAALVLESGAAARSRQAEPLARVAGWGTASDAYHVCQPHPKGEGMAAAIGAALRRAGWTPEQIDYVNAHGTGTKINDSAETAALRTAFGPAAERIPVSSTKSTTGHLLEGSGAVEAVISLLALQDGVLPPTAGHQGFDPQCDLDWIPNEPRTAEVRRVLSVNAAFGGLNTAILLERP